MNELLDTNVILRYLVGDNEEQQQKATAIFKEAEQGKRKIFLKVVVVAETCFVLESFYKKTKDEIASAMDVFLSQKWLKVEERPSLLSMWDLFRQNLHFVDCYLLALSKTNKFKIITFDKDLNRKTRS